MATKTVTDQSFATDVLGADGPVLVDFWAEWCGPCRMIAPALEEISNELGDKVTIAKLNIDENPDIPGRYGVRGIPTMLLFKGGQPVAQKVGAAPRSQIQQWLEGNLDAASRSRQARRSFGGSVPSSPRVSGRNLSWRGRSSPVRTSRPCCPEDVEARRDRVGIVERRDAEIDRFGLVVDLHQERRSAFAAKVRWPKLDEGTDRTLSAPLVQTRSPSARWRRPSPGRRCSAGRCGSGTSRNRTARSSVRSGPRRTCIRRSFPSTLPSIDYG